MPDRYKFEMIRFDESAQIHTCHTVKTQSAVCTEVVCTFAEFLLASGFTKDTIASAYRQVENELSNV